MTKNRTKLIGLVDIFAQPEVTAVAVYHWFLTLAPNRTNI